MGLDGWNVDTICVSVCDTMSNQCHIICYIPSVLPFNPCNDTIITPDSLHYFTSNCAAGATACLDIPYQEMVNYTILDNGLLCGWLPRLRRGYDDRLLGAPAGGQPVFGPYTLNEWKINGVTYSVHGFDWIGQFDEPTRPRAGLGFAKPILPRWRQYAERLRCAARDFGQRRGWHPATEHPTANGTELRFGVGTHKVIFKHIQTGCADSLTVVVECVNCPPLHGYGPQPVFGYQFPLDDCDGDTVFNTLILAAELPNYTTKVCRSQIRRSGKPTGSCATTTSRCRGRAKPGRSRLSSWDIDGVILPGTTVSNVDGILSFLNSNDPAGGPSTKDATLFNLCTSNWKQHDYNSITLSQKPARRWPSSNLCSKPTTRSSDLCSTRATTKSGWSTT